VEEEEDLCEEEDAEPVLQRVLHLQRVLRPDPGESIYLELNAFILKHPQQEVLCSV